MGSWITGQTVQITLTHRHFLLSLEDLLKLAGYFLNRIRQNLKLLLNPSKILLLVLLIISEAINSLIQTLDRSQFIHFFQQVCYVDIRSKLSKLLIPNFYRVLNSISIFLYCFCHQFAIKLPRSNTLWCQVSEFSRVQFTFKQIIKFILVHFYSQIYLELV